ncbi:MAG: hypothetical protein NC131_13650 [Roseburia sp.]|nr:hypothetical protein [Roseburia sp.]
MAIPNNSDKDIIEELNELALEANWGTVERVNGVPKPIAVIQEAIGEIKRLRELPKEILQTLYYEIDREKEVSATYDDFTYALGVALGKVEFVAEKYGVELDENV